MKRGCLTAAAPTTGFGWVWAQSSHHALNVAYTPDSNYQFNSVVGPNWVTRTGVGTYVVFLPGISAGGGVTHVTAYGGVKARCKLIGTDTTPNGQYLKVRCYTLGGVLQDNQFTASYTNMKTRIYPFGYLSPAGQHNSTGAGNTKVPGAAVGTYLVTMPGIDSEGGTEHVTAQGQDANWCKVGTSYRDGSNHRVVVNCFTPTGAPAPSDFHVTYVAKGNIVGADYDFESEFAWMDLRGPGVHATYRFENGRPTGTPWGVTPTGDSSLLTAPAPPLDTGDVQVTAFGSGPVSCGVVWWNTTGIKVQCHDPAGTAVTATTANVSFLGARIPG